MKAYKCDICGNYYTKIKWNRINKFEVRLGDAHSYADICPECANAIQTVIDQRMNLNSKEN